MGEGYRQLIKKAGGGEVFWLIGNSWAVLRLIL